MTVRRELHPFTGRPMPGRFVVTFDRPLPATRSTKIHIRFVALPTRKAPAR